jgi:hypothetical protein
MKVNGRFGGTFHPILYKRLGYLEYQVFTKVFEKVLDLEI